MTFSGCYGNCLGGSQEVVSELVDIFFKRLGFERLEWKSRIWGLVPCLEGTREAGAGAEIHPLERSWTETIGTHRLRNPGAGGR